MKIITAFLIATCISSNAPQDKAKQLVKEDKMEKQDLFEKSKIETQSNEVTRMVVEDFYNIQFGRKKGNITDLFADEIDWDLPGNKEKFPWTGKRQTKKEIEEFFQILYHNIESVKFDIDFISVNGENATVVGNLSSKILKYDKVFDTEFVVIFKVIDGKIVKYHFLEDSYKLNKEMK